MKHQGILTMIVTDPKPFNIVNDPGFLNYSKLLDPRFTVGSAMYYRRLLDKAFIKGKDKVQTKLKEAEPTSVSIQLDGWSQHHHGYIGLLVNYITKGWRSVWPAHLMTLDILVKRWPVGLSLSVASGALLRRLGL